MFRLAVRGILWALVLLTFPLAAAQTWDAAHDFQAVNPAGPWTYGWKTAPTGALTPFTNYQATVAAFPGRDAWQSPGVSTTLAVYHNTVGFSGDIPPSMLLLQP